MTNEELNLQRALALHQDNKLDEAKKIYQVLLTQTPRNASVLHLLGILAAQQNDLNLAYQYLTQALAIEPHASSIHNSLGNTLKNLGEFHTALQHYQIALQIHPDNPSLHNNIAIIKQKLGNPESAIHHYRQALQLNPKYSDAHYNLGLLLLQQRSQHTQDDVHESPWETSRQISPENISEAIHHLTNVIQLQPRHAPAHSQLAYAYQQQNKNDAAINYYQQSLRLEYSNANAHHNLATLLIAKNKIPAAVYHLKRTIQLEPSHREAFHNLGNAFLLQNNPEAALKYFLQLINWGGQKSQDFNVYYNLGVIYNDINRFIEAIDYFIAALKINPKAVAAHINLGAIYLRQENYAAAFHHYHLAAQLQPENKELEYILAGLRQNQSDIEINNANNHPLITNQTPATLNTAHATGLSNPSAAPAEYIQHLFDNYARTYDKHLELLEYQAPQLLYDALANKLPAIHPTLTPAPNSRTILDLGCGTGLCGAAMRELACSIVGVDLSEKMLAVAAQKKIYEELKLGTIEELLLHYANGPHIAGHPANSSFNLIIAGDALSYIGDLKNVFARCAQILEAASTTQQPGLFAFTLEGTATHHPYTLQRSLRFAHSQRYVEELAHANNFSILYSTQAKLRKHRDTVTECLLYVLATIIS
jgi:predicted TPR repeat methyltransferase/Flp pilus assembly protein TadD